MKWVTKANVHFDRVASAWLIKRFIDSEAEFDFLSSADPNDRPADAFAFGLPGAEFSDHDEWGTTFAKLMAHFHLDDRALQSINTIVAHGVEVIVHSARHRTGDRHGALVPGLLALAEGVMLASPQDQEVVRQGLVIYDALYAFLCADLLLEARGESPPPDIGPDAWRAMYVAALTSHLRDEGQGTASLQREPDGAFEQRLLAVRATLTELLRRKSDPGAPNISEPERR